MTQPTEHGSSPQDSRIRPHIHHSEAESEQSVTSADIAAQIRAAIGPQHFDHWLEHRSRFAINGSQLQIFVPNPFIANWLLKRFRKQFGQAAAAVLGPSAQYDVTVDESLQDPRQKTPADPGKQQDGPLAGGADVLNRPSSGGEAQGGQSNANTRRSLPQPLAVPAAKRRRFSTFASLVTGESNDLAVMAGQQVAEFPGERFNPLYLYGPTGVGKTHLLESIYSDCRSRHADLNVMYISSEAFTNYFTQALQAKTVPSFRQRFRNVNVLLVDNVEFLDNKRATQEEFLHTVVQVIEHGGQVVVSGDRHPRLLTKHREELTTRFMSGLVCRIDTPDEEMRLRIANSLALPVKNVFTREALEFVARRCHRNVREIQGALNCLNGHYALNNKRITAARAREILGEMERECRRLVRLSDVEKVICDAFGLTAADLRSGTRRKAVSCPRSLAMFVARKLTKLAYREIGLYFGGRDHSTVVAALKRVQKWVDEETPLELPSSCSGRTIAEVVVEIEERLLSLAS